MFAIADGAVNYYNSLLPCLPALALAELLGLLADSAGAAPEVNTAVVAGALRQVVLPAGKRKTRQ